MEEIMEPAFNRKYELARESGNHYYGDGGTIHGTSVLDIEVDAKGKVTAVWFRCLVLPFRVVTRPDSFECNPNAKIHGIEWSSADD